MWEPSQHFLVRRLFLPWGLNSFFSLWVLIISIFQYVLFWSYWNYPLLASFFFSVYLPGISGKKYKYFHKIIWGNKINSFETENMVACLLRIGRLYWDSEISLPGVKVFVIFKGLFGNMGLERIKGNLISWSWKQLLKSNLFLEHT